VVAQLFAEHGSAPASLRWPGSCGILASMDGCEPVKGGDGAAWIAEGYVNRRSQRVRCRCANQPELCLGCTWGDRPRILLPGRAQWESNAKGSRGAAMNGRHPARRLWCWPSSDCFAAARGPSTPSGARGARGSIRSCWPTQRLPGSQPVEYCRGAGRRAKIAGERQRLVWRRWRCGNDKQPCKESSDGSSAISAWRFVVPLLRPVWRPLRCRLRRCGPINREPSGSRSRLSGRRCGRAARRYLRPKRWLLLNLPKKPPTQKPRRAESAEKGITLKSHCGSRPRQIAEKRENR